MATLKDSKAAEDLVQDTFFALYLNGLQHFNENNNAKSWLIKTAKHKTFNYIRCNSRSIPIAAGFFEEIEGDESLYLKVEEEEIVEALVQAIELLPEIYKAVVIFYHFNQMPQSEIAATLQIPLGTVKSRLNKARRLLKSHLIINKVTVTDVRNMGGL